MNLRIFILSVFFLLGLSASRADSQSFIWQGEEVNERDANGKRQGLWVYLGKHKNLPGYAAEDLVEKGNFVNDRKDGVWISYYPGNRKKSEIEYRMNRPMGSYVKYYESKPGEELIVEEQGTWKGNRYTGSFQRNYPDGTPQQIKTFNDAGKEDGEVKYFHPNGEVELEYTKSNGTLEGTQTRYYENGDVKEVVEFGADGEVANRVEKDPVNPLREQREVQGSGVDASAGQLNAGDPNAGRGPKDGYHKVYNDQQDLWMDGEFKNGKLWNGKLYVYDSDNLLLKIKIYKNGAYIGDGVLEY